MSPVVLLMQSDDWVCDRLSRWAPPAWIAVATIAATRLGDGWAWLAVIVAAGAVRGPKAALLETATAVVAVNATQVALKRGFRRARPVAAVRGARLAVTAPDRFSFPSGHTMNAFAVAVLVAIHLPLVGPWAFAVAGTVGASRVVLRLHYVSDVVAGAALGSALAAAVAVLSAS